MDFDPIPWLVIFVILIEIYNRFNELQTQTSDFGVFYQIVSQKQIFPNTECNIWFRFFFFHVVIMTQCFNQIDLRIRTLSLFGQFCIDYSITFQSIQKMFTWIVFVLTVRVACFLNTKWYNVVTLLWASMLMDGSSSILLTFCVPFYINITIDLSNNTPSINMLAEWIGMNKNLSSLIEHMTRWMILTQRKYYAIECFRII